MKSAELIKSLLSSVPLLPGVYSMLGSDSQILYIGKAKNLKNRLASYTRPDLPVKTARMIYLTCKLEYTVTASEIDALLLEAQLIKKFQPKFNILLKDDKSFPYIKLRLDHEFPQIMKYRGINLDGDRFFGPFISPKQVDTTLIELQKIFKLRSCTDNYFATRKRPCLQYQIKRCTAPCTNKISKLEYEELVRQAQDFLSGKTHILQQNLAKKMEELSVQMKFEEAAELRDRIKALSYIQLKSGLMDSGIVNADVVAIAELYENYCIEVFIYRNGQACGHKSYFPTNTEFSNISEVLTSFINQFYQTHTPPSEIILNHPVNDAQLFIKSINKLHETKTVITIPKNGAKYDLVNNAYKNSQLALEQKIKNMVKNSAIFTELQQLFKLSSIPKRIEIYDNSHIMGDFAVGAMVVATESGFDKKEYRVFNISNSNHGDDYQMLREVLTRRFARLRKENMSKKPDLMIIDGGKGHLKVVKELIHDFGLNIVFVCMSKGALRNAGNEKFYMVDRESFTLDNNSNLMKYLQILRDEVHNFAIKNHRMKRSKNIKYSSLDNIPNIGEVRKKMLLHYFGSYHSVCQATIEELSKVQGISKSIAKTIFETLHQDI